jgi:hypothetical protein
MVSTRILGPVHDNEKEKWRILTNKEIYTMENGRKQKSQKSIIYEFASNKAER